MKYTRYFIIWAFVCGLVLAACEKELAVENDSTTRSTSTDSDSTKNGDKRGGQIHVPQQ